MKRLLLPDPIKANDIRYAVRSKHDSSIHQRRQHVRKHLCIEFVFTQGLYIQSSHLHRVYIYTGFIFTWVVYIYIGFKFTYRVIYNTIIQVYGLGCRVWG